MLIVPSIASESAAEARDRMSKFSHDQLVEIRLDRMKDFNLSLLLEKPRPKVIITNRRSDQGGGFRGSETAQFGIMREAISLGADYIDVELAWGSGFIRKLRENQAGTKIICSYHQANDPVADIPGIYRLMKRAKPDVMKIVVNPAGLNDNLKIFSLLRTARSQKKKLIAHATGEDGEISRIMGGIFGNYLSYSSLPGDTPTAPGQISFDQLKQIYRAHMADRRTKIFGLVGNPVKFSSGYLFHNARFSRRGINALYLNFLVKDLPSFISDFKIYFNGLSVTMPHKTEIAGLIDHPDELVSRSGVCNTVIRRRDKLFGHNTDLAAALWLLRKHLRPKKKKVTILGTGATARTMAVASVILGADPILVGRDPEKTRILAATIGCGWDRLSSLGSGDIDVLINATPVGMAGNRMKSIVPAGSLKKGMVVFDVVYNPPVTKLMNDAKVSGCEVVSGQELFKKQAEIQSKLFIDSIT